MHPSPFERASRITLLRRPRVSSLRETLSVKQGIGPMSSPERYEPFVLLFFELFLRLTSMIFHLGPHLFPLGQLLC